MPFRHTILDFDVFRRYVHVLTGLGLFRNNHKSVKYWEKQGNGRGGGRGGEMWVFPALHRIGGIKKISIEKGCCEVLRKAIEKAEKTSEYRLTLRIFRGKENLGGIPGIDEILGDCRDVVRIEVPARTVKRPKNDGEQNRTNQDN